MGNKQIKMNCKAYIKDFEFKVGNKYLTILDNDFYKYKNPKAYKFLLNDEVKQKLIEIRDETSAHDFRRTYLVLKLVASEYDEHFIDFEN